MKTCKPTEKFYSLKEYFTKNQSLEVFLNILSNEEYITVRFDYGEDKYSIQNAIPISYIHQISKKFKSQLDDIEINL